MTEMHVSGGGMTEIKTGEQGPDHKVPHVTCEGDWI